MAVCGSCSRAPCSCVPRPGAPGCLPVGPGLPRAPQNTPPDTTYLACTPAWAQQAAVDAARKIPHTIGYRAYRVRLVWQVRNDEGRWVEDASLELMPVDVRGMDNVDLVVEAPGQVPAGVITLREVSTTMSEWDLRGYRNGEPWGDDTPAREFFYEVQQIAGCPGQREPRTYRFVLAGAPDLRMDNHEWRVRLTSQLGHRTEDRVDQTVVDGDDVFDGALLLG